MMDVSRMSARLIAPKAKVVPYLQQLLAEGEQLARQPVADMDDLVKAGPDGMRWINHIGHVLRRAFWDDPFWMAMFQPHDGVPTWPTGEVGIDFYLAYREASWAHQLAILRRAIAVAEEAEE